MPKRVTAKAVNSQAYNPSVTVVAVYSARSPIPKYLASSQPRGSYFCETCLKRPSLIQYPSYSDKEISVTQNKVNQGPFCPASKKPPDLAASGPLAKSLSI